MSIESSARELAAWFTSGNSVPVDLRHTVKLNGDRIMEDVARLHRSIHEDDRSTSDVYPMMEQA